MATRTKSLKATCSWFEDDLDLLKSVSFENRPSSITTKKYAERRMRDLLRKLDGTSFINSEFKESEILEILFRVLSCLTWSSEDGTTFSCDTSRPTQHEFYRRKNSFKTKSNENITAGAEYYSDPKAAYYANLSWLQHIYYLTPKPLD